MIASKQFEIEWNIYQKVLNQSYNILQTIPWIELRGNHGNQQRISTLLNNTFL